MAYHKFKNADGEEFGSFETFKEDDGWYWWSGFPGCLPDGDAQGPFDTEEAAVEDAQMF